MHLYINVHSHNQHDDNSITIINNRLGFDTHLHIDKPFSVGIHPWDTKLSQSKLVQELESYLNHKNCLALGECGLDKLLQISITQQIEVFETQLALASQYNKPVLIHCVKAYDEVINCCLPYLNKIPLIIHGFNKSSEMAQQLISKGFYLSINQSFILKENSDLSVIPIDKLFIETDDKQDYKIQELYALVAQKLNMKETLLKAKIYSNFETVFYGKTS